MTTAIPMLLIVATVAFAPQSAAQKTRTGKTGSRTLVDVPSRPARGACGHATCAAGIIDLGTDRCIKASSTPTFGVLFPYPGINNTFVGPAFVGGGDNNQATGPWSTVGGGYYNNASGGFSTVAGGHDNTASDAAATIGGGGSNTASGDHATVAGGEYNAASARQATVGGGGYNTASGYWATVGGGYSNTASGGLATVGGGCQNTASADYATVGGGRQNTASGVRATVAGGSGNLAQGYFSFAAGRKARANHDGAFVWGDSRNAAKPSSVPDEFNVYCSGGARFFTNSAATTGVLLAPGGGSWSAVSDRDSKENVEAVDAREVLAQVVSMPLSTWNYKAQDDSIRHMGPMAQDFHAAFGLGVSDKLIDTIDPDGVALAAIQGLHALVQEKDAEIEDLRARQAIMEAQLAELITRVEDQTASR